MVSFPPVSPPRPYTPTISGEKQDLRNLVVILMKIEYILGSDVLSFGEKFLIFRQIVVPPSSGSCCLWSSGAHQKFCIGKGGEGWLTPKRYKGKSKSIPLETWRGPEIFRRLRLPDFKKIGK